MSQNAPPKVSAPPHLDKLLAEIQGEAGLDQKFLALVVASCAIATLGLLENSSPVIIGAMLIAPLMTPIVALALGIVDGRLWVSGKAFLALLAGSTVAVALSALISAAAHLPVPGSAVLARAHPNLLDLGVALSAGAIAGYARLRKEIAATIGGAAIAVALMPPLCVVGIGLSIGRRELAYGAFLLFLTNFVGITFACALVFVLSGLATERTRRGLLITAAVLALVAIPLGFATKQLVDEERLEAALHSALIYETQTFKRVELVATNVDWLSTPVHIDLLVRSHEPITATEARYLQDFAEKKLGRKLDLTIEVSEVQIVRPASQR